MVTRRNFAAALFARMSSAAFPHGEGNDISSANTASKQVKAPLETRAAFDPWKNYARELEQKLADAQAGLTGMRTLKDVAITELGKVDPDNYLMIRANRQKILDEAYTKA